MNPAIEAVGGSVIRALHARRKPGSIDLGLGEPTLKPNVAYFERATQWTAEHGCRYSSNIGHDDLRELIAARYAYPELDDKANVCMMTGSQEAVYVAIKTLLDPARDEVLLVEPAFPVYAKIAEVEGIHVRRVTMDPSDDCAFDAQRILGALGPRTRLIVLCSPCNPTGRVISKDAVATIARALLAREGPPVYVLHDEIYREITYTGDAGEFGKVYPYTIAVNSLSKSNALTGLRIGWLIAPRDVMPEIVKMHGWATSCAGTFAQRVAFEIFAAGDLRGHTDWYAAQRSEALAAARAEGLRAIEPEGAFYLCLEVGAEDTLGFVERLIDDSNVIAIPGHIFSPSLRGWLRTSFVASPEDIRRGYARIAELAASVRAERSSAELTPGLRS
jgi:aspartate/methionine/tyrosine aminotransferase